jgi:hypothetical protein
MLFTQIIELYINSDSEKFTRIQKLNKFVKKLVHRLVHKLVNLLGFRKRKKNQLVKP